MLHIPNTGYTFSLTRPHVQVVAQCGRALPMCKTHVEVLVELHLPPILISLTSYALSSSTREGNLQQALILNKLQCQTRLMHNQIPQCTNHGFHDTITKLFSLKSQHLNQISYLMRQGNYIYIYIYIWVMLMSVLRKFVNVQVQKNFDTIFIKNIKSCH